MMKIIKKIPLQACDYIYTDAIFSGNSYILLDPKNNKICIYTVN